VKKKRFSVEHIAAILKLEDLGTPVSELCRQHGISEQSYHRWKKLYGSMEPSEARELRQMREENTPQYTVTRSVPREGRTRSGG
jgi:putative transposase